MACTTILVGKKASYDGSTMIARNDDSPSGRFTPKKYVVVHPDEQPRKYISVLSHVEIDLPDNPILTQEYLVQTRSLFISRPKTDRKKSKAVLVKKTSSALYCHIFTVPERVSNASAVCLSSMALMK